MGECLNAVDEEWSWADEHGVGMDSAELGAAGDRNTLEQGCRALERHWQAVPAWCRDQEVRSCFGEEVRLDGVGSMAGRTEHVGCVGSSDKVGHPVAGTEQRVGPLEHSDSGWMSTRDCG